MVSKFDKAIDKLVIGIGDDYQKWSSPLKSDSKSMSDIKKKMIGEFKDGIKLRNGQKYIKVITGTSVWGFIAKSDGVHKGIPYRRGDVFKAAGWRAPAKHVRGSIFDDSTSWFSWTGPRYL